MARWPAAPATPSGGRGLRAGAQGQPAAVAATPRDHGQGGYRRQAQVGRLERQLPAQGPLAFGVGRG